MQRSSEDRDKLPPKFGDKIDLLGSLIESVGNVLTIAGLSAEVFEIEEIEQQVDENGEPLSKLDTDVGFVLALIGATIITIGDAISATGVAIQIKDDIKTEAELEKENQERDVKLNELQSQVTYLQNEVQYLAGLTDSMQRELAFLKKAPNRYFRS